MPLFFNHLIHRYQLATSLQKTTLPYVCCCSGDLYLMQMFHSLDWGSCFAAPDVAVAAATVAVTSAVAVATVAVTSAAAAVTFVVAAVAVGAVAAAAVKSAVAAVTVLVVD